MTGGNTTKVVFVAGLTHSGSTMLDLLLGGHSQLVGLGEAASMICRKPDRLAEPHRICSCGAGLRECVFWSRIIQEPISRLPVDQRYLHLLSVFREVFGPGRIPVDSSKSFSSLKLLMNLEDVDLQVLHIVRDVRAWTVSHVELDKRRRKQGGNKIRAEYAGRLWLYYLQRFAGARFALWYHGNRQLQNALEQAPVPSMLVSYEKLALNGCSAVEEMCTFLGIRHEPLMTLMHTSHSHIALGNPMRLDPIRRSSIHYDYSWLSRREWLLPSLVMPWIMAYNNQHVYRGWDNGRSHLAEGRSAAVII